MGVTGLDGEREGERCDFWNFEYEYMLLRGSGRLDNTYCGLGGRIRFQKQDSSVTSPLNSLLSRTRNCLGYLTYTDGMDGRLPSVKRPWLLRVVYLGCRQL